jgi:hypothetical protein
MAIKPAVSIATAAEITTITMKPTRQVAIALPVEKSSACRTAITMATRLHIEAIKTIIAPRIGIKNRILRTPGEEEKPMQRKSSP